MSFFVQARSFFSFRKTILTKRFGLRAARPHIPYKTTKLPHFPQNPPTLALALERDRPTKKKQKTATREKQKTPRQPPHNTPNKAQLLHAHTRTLPRRAERSINTLPRTSRAAVRVTTALQTISTRFLWTKPWTKQTPLWSLSLVPPVFRATDRRFSNYFHQEINKK